MNSIYFKTFCYLILAGILLSCGGDIQFAEVKNVDQNTWHKDTTYSFTDSIVDTSQVYTVFIDFRHKTEYKYKNIFFFLTTNMPNGKMVKDTVNFMLADEQGYWRGNGISDIRAVSGEIKKYTKFPEPGNYKFNISHGMRDTILKEVESVGIRIELAKFN